MGTTPARRTNAKARIYEWNPIYDRFLQHLGHDLLGSTMCNWGEQRRLQERFDTENGLALLVMLYATVCACASGDVVRHRLRADPLHDIPA